MREASVEKRILHHIAPHLAEPLAFVFPTYRGRDWPLWQLRLGVKVYDLPCGGRNLGKSSSMHRDEVSHRIPQLDRAQLTGAVRYFDGLTNDARLVLDTLRSAASAGGWPVNYAQFEDARREGDLWRCDVRDVLDGRSYEALARTIVNATGPWAAGLPHSQLKLRLTKGIHLVVDRRRLPVPDAVVITQDRRILFVIPWGDRIIIGTTDTDYPGSLDEVHADREDVAYVLRALADFFPKAALTEHDVISTWAGLRPLIVPQGGTNGTPSDLSRAHEIRNPEPGWWDVAGGKLTTYRLMAEQTVGRIVESLEGLGALNREVAPCRTADEPLLPVGETAGVSGILPPEFNRRVVEHLCANEWAVHLDDVMVRRTNWHYYSKDANQKAERVADWMGEWLGWSDDARAAELHRYRAAGPGQTAAADSSSRPATHPHDEPAHPVV